MIIINSGMLISINKWLIVSKDNQQYKEPTSEENIIDEEKTVYETLPSHNFSEFKDINTDFRLIIHFSDRSIPVVQSKNNKEYERINIFGEADSMGTAMLDYKSSENSYNRIIHGHSSTRNELIFTPFKSLGWIKENATFEVEYESLTITYQIISFYQIDWNVDQDYDMLNRDIKNEIELIRHIEQQEKRSDIKFAEYPKENLDHLLTILTCDARYTNARYVLVAIPVY